MRQYEAMFIFDSTFATDFAAVEKEVDRIMNRAGGEVILCRKWEERKLAYEINKRKRGCYVLCFFRAATDKIVGLERDCVLSESILRVLVLRAEEVTPKRMELMFEERAEREGGSDDYRRGDRPAKPVEKKSESAAAPEGAATATAVAAEPAAAEPAVEEAAPAPVAEDAAPAAEAAADDSESTDKE